MSVIPYFPESYPDFTQNAPAEEMKKALQLVRTQLGKHYPLIIGEDTIKTDEVITVINPAKPSEVIGSVSKANSELVDKAIQIANQTFKCWRNVAPDERARYLFKTAALLRRRKYEFCAWLCFEISKSWIEAYAEVAEAIDFIELYAREMMRLGIPQPVTPVAGEENETRWIPLGVGAVIPPWNFPLAIMAGMVTAALVSGNTVVLKPASASPIVAAKFMELLIEAGVPAGVVNFVPGSGAEVGDVMVCHPLTRFIAFTGSKEVGLRIFEFASKVQPGQIWLKRTILEMGGKDCMAVDAVADLEGAARESVAAGYGFQGQKCSAGSRLIIHEKGYDDVVSMFAERTKKLKVGNPTEENVDMGAVIEANAYKKINSYIEVGKGEGKLLAQSAIPSGEGFYIPATAFCDVNPNARIAQEEIFGPVVAIIKAKSFDEILEIANGTEYGLTGALFSNNREHIEKARHDFHVGNLYFNRKCTGALVGVQPFGGFNMSGTDSKAGGYDYLQLFMQVKTICERW